MITRELRSTLVIATIAAAIVLAVCNQIAMATNPVHMPIQLPFFVNVFVVALCIASVSIASDT